MEFATFEVWKEHQVLNAIESGGSIKLTCGECRGDGLVECDMGHQHDCPECDGEGFINSDDETELSEIIKSYKPKRGDYFNSMINTFELLALKTNKPIIDIVGPFIKYWDKEKWRY